MSRPAVFLDRDGTVSRYMEYCRRPEDLQLLPGAGEAIRRLNDSGWRVFVVTNQSAVGRGWLTPDGLEAIHDKFRRELARVGAKVDAIYVCPHAPDAGCACRKPGIALLKQAAREWGVSLAESYVVGDRWLDVRTGLAAGATAVLVRGGHPPEPAEGVAPHYTASTLDDAVRWMMTRPRGPWLPRYRELAEAMYEARRLCPGWPVLGVSTVCPRHSVPPEHLRLLADRAPGASRRLPAWHVMTARWLWCVAWAVRETAALAWSRLRLGGALRRASRSPAAVVLKTWCFGPESLARADDFYYGTLPQQLEARGIPCVVLCGDTREAIDLRFARAALSRGPVRMVPDYLLVPAWVPLATVVRQWAAAAALRRAAARTADPQVAAVCTAACLGNLQPITMRNRLHFYSARNAVARWKARVFVTLYEGQPWEQPAWQGVKAADPRCALVGYQHTVIMPHSLAVLSPARLEGERPAPDVVLCLGDVTRELMAAGHRTLGTRLVPFGSFRKPAQQPAPQPPRPQRRTVLVLPEGLPREAKLLFDFAMRLAGLLPDHRFVFRCHPVLPFERVRSSLESDPARLPNITHSRGGPIQDDFDQASVVLYRGSSSVLYALPRGVKPVYVEDDEYPHVDPLFPLTGWREHAASPEDAAALLRGYAASDAASVRAPWEAAVAYADAYTTAVTEASIDRLLDAVGLSARPAAHSRPHVPPSGGLPWSGLASDRAEPSGAVR